MSILVLDAYQRGAWIAREMAIKGFEVSYVDVTNKMGPHPVEDVEGPYAMFVDDHLSATQRECLFLPSLVEPCHRGMVLRVQKKIFEFNGPLAQESKKKLGLSESFIDQMKTTSAHVESSEWTWEKKIVGLSRQYSATQYTDPIQSPKFGDSCAFALPAYLRRRGRRDVEESLKWLSGSGVRTYSEAGIQDIGTQGRSHCRGIEVQSKEWAGFVEASEVLCFLSSAELNWLKPGLYRKIFATDPLEPIWAWRRFRFQLGAHPAIKGLPMHWLNVEDVDLPWAHENFLIVNGTYDDKLWDVWMRLPQSQTLRTEYMDQMGQRLLEFWQDLLPGVQCQIHEKPPEYQYNRSELSPPPFVVYAERHQRKASRLNNWSNCSPEVMINCDSHSRMRFLQDIAGRRQRSDTEEASK